MTRQKGERPARTEPRAYVANATDPEQLDDAARREAHAERQRGDDMRFVLSTPEGRRTLWRLVQLFEPLTSVFLGDDAQTNHRAGLHSAGILLVSEINAADPEAFPKMWLDQVRRDANG